MQKRILAVLLTAIMLLGELPGAWAANEESVLTAIGHGQTDTVTLSGAQRNVTLTVPFQYPSSVVQLTDELIIAYDQTKYKAVVAAPESSSTATVDSEDYTAIQVSFLRKAESNSAPKSQTVYYIRVVRAQAKAPVFSGVMGRTMRVGSTWNLTAQDFRANYVRNDGADIGYLQISGSNLVTGTLSYSGGNVFGAPITLNEAGELTGSLTFQALAPGVVSYNVKAFEQGTNQLAGSAVLTITVYDVPRVTNYTGSAYVGGRVNYASLGLSQQMDLRGGSLELLELAPSDQEAGVWYLGTQLLAAETSYSISAAQLNSLSFEGRRTGTASFAWRIKNEAGFSDYGAGTIAVSSPSLILSSGSGPRVTRGSTHAFSSADFSYSPSSVPITYVKILSVPAATEGYLCLSTALAKSNEYGYPAIGANAALRADAIIPYSYLPYLRLVTKTTGTAESVSFSWTATADLPVSQAIWAAPASYTLAFATGGTVSYQGDMNIPLDLSAADFSSAFYSSTGQVLSYVTFTPPARTAGTLYYNYDYATKKGTAVSSATKYYTASSPNLSHLTFVPAGDYVGQVVVPYQGYRADGQSVDGKLYITITNSGGGILSYTTDKNDAIQLDAADFSAAFLEATGKKLTQVQFSLPASSQGKLYYDYTSPSDYDSAVSATKRYQVYSSPYLSYVSFVPAQGYTGKISIFFTAYDAQGVAYSGKLIVFVVDSPAGIVSYSARTNGLVSLSGQDFFQEFIGATGSLLSYVQIVPPAASVGSLYTDYSTETGTGTKVTSATKLYHGGTPDISSLVFVPAKDYVGKVEMKYTAYTPSGVSYAGKLKVQVGQSGSGSISYTTNFNTPFSLYAADFTTKFYANTGGKNLTCVSFSLPPTAYGKLYYRYNAAGGYGTAVTGGTLYYVSASPALSDITFVPKTGYSGTFTIDFTGFDAEGTGFNGKINVTVGNPVGTVQYDVTSPGAVTFSPYDFGQALGSVMGSTLSSISFVALPPSSQGTLYYAYNQSLGYGSQVSVSSRYYLNGGYPTLGEITFVPQAGYSGTVLIDYIAYDVYGSSYYGTVRIEVSGSTGGRIEYDTEKNKAAIFRSSDFYTAFLEQTGSSLSYVTFTLPAASQGTLYHRYQAGSSSTKVSAYTRYYPSASPMISEVSFVPAANFTGTVSIPYTAYTGGGVAYTGTVQIMVIDLNTHPFVDVANYDWADQAIAYLYHKGVMTGVGNNRFAPAQPLSRGDFMLMLCRAFSFEADATANFTDVLPGTYYFQAVLTAKALGIAQGSSNYFYPTQGIARQDGAVFLYRALAVAGVTLEKGSAGDLARFSDAGKIQDYAKEAMAALVRNGILIGNSQGLNPEGIVTRSEMAVILYRVLKML